MGSYLLLLPFGILSPIVLKILLNLHRLPPFALVNIVEINAHLLTERMIFLTSILQS